MRLVECSVGPLRESGARLRGVVETAAGERILPYVDYEGAGPEQVGCAADVLAIALLLPAIRSGEALTIRQPVDRRLAFNLPRIRDVFHTWWPDGFPAVPIEMPVPRDDAGGAAAGATFFSGGVDSFYTLLKYRRGAPETKRPLSHIVFMRGVETPLERARRLGATESRMREIAAAAGVSCVTGETNVRTVLQYRQPALHWERHYHGSALAAIAVGLSPALGYVCIPSAFSYNHLVAHGSTPLVDEMFSTAAMQIVHDGAEATRAEKVGKIVEWDGPLVLEHLRVCIANNGADFNCGYCYKCVRTAVPLHVLGVWDRVRTFRRKDTGHWEDLIAQDHAVLTEENLRFAREHGGSRKLVQMLERALRRRRRKERVLAVLRRPPLDRTLPLLRRVNDRFQRR